MCLFIVCFRVVVVFVCELSRKLASRVGQRESQFLVAMTFTALLLSLKRNYVFCYLSLLLLFSSSFFIIIFLFFWIVCTYNVLIVVAALLICCWDYCCWCCCCLPLLANSKTESKIKWTQGKWIVVFPLKCMAVRQECFDIFYVVNVVAFVFYFYYLLPLSWFSVFSINNNTNTFLHTCPLTPRYCVYR